jgi:C4-dicarboxylate-specific signal transduction histidine kinase
VAASGSLVTFFFVVIFIMVVREREALVASMRAEAQAHNVRIVGQLAGKVAHDFNNLLTAISGNLELARLELDPLKRQEALDIALKATSDGAGLVARVVAYAGKSRMQPDVQSSEQVLQLVARAARGNLPEGVSIKRSTRAKDYWFFADRVSTVAALVGIVLNAAETIQQTGGTIHLSAEQIRNSNFVAIVVTYKGPGFRTYEFAGFSEPFEGSDAAVYALGFELAAAYEVAKKSGGDLQFALNIGRGMEVRMLLPKSQSTTRNSAES